MKKTFSLVMLFCVYAVAALGQTFYEVGEAKTATELTTGTYVLKGMSTHGTGLCYYEESGSNRHYRYDLNMSATKTGDNVASSYVWNVEVSGGKISVTLLDDETKFFPKDASKNQNFSGTEKASLIPEDKTIGTESYIVLTLEDANIGYVHANAPGGNPNLSYWSAYGETGTCVKFTFYKATLLSELEAAKAELQAMLDRYDAFPWDVIGGYVKSDAVIAAKTEADEIKDSEDITALTTATTNLSNALNEVKVFEPETGKFYRLKNYSSNNYMSDNGTTFKLLANGGSLPSTVFYLDENKSFISFVSGRNLDCQGKTYGNIGSSYPGEFNIAYGGAKANVITYKNNSYWTYGAGADGASLDRGSNTPNDNGYSWTIEEVKWLPIPMNEEIGFATIFSPVQLELSSNRVKAYSGSINAEENVVELTSLEAVPANTGVVLELQEGAEIDNGCVYLQVQNNTLTDVESQLEGTAASAYVAGPAYVLSQPEGKEVGFYAALLNKNSEGAAATEGGTHFIANGFKAYLPVESTPANAQLFLGFCFGNSVIENLDGTETAIESIQGAGNAGAVVYDLAGRRVQNAQKGLYIVNGKKVIK